MSRPIATAILISHSYLRWLAVVTHTLHVIVENKMQNLNEYLAHVIAS